MERYAKVRFTESVNARFQHFLVSPPYFHFYILCAAKDLKMIKCNARDSCRIPFPAVLLRAIRVPSQMLPLQMYTPTPTWPSRPCARSLLSRPRSVALPWTFREETVMDVLRGNKAPAGKKAPAWSVFSESLQVLLSSGSPDLTLSHWRRVPPKAGKDETKILKSSFLLRR
jgi:hypothetical protein